MPYEVLEENLASQILLLQHYHPLFATKFGTHEDGARLSQSQRSELFNLLVREEVVRLLQQEYRRRSGSKAVLFFPITFDSLPSEWTGRFDALYDLCSKWTSELTLWPLGHSESPTSGMHWRSALAYFSEQSGGSYHHEAGDAQDVITDSNTGGKFRLWPVPDCVEIIVQNFLAGNSPAANKIPTPTRTPDDTERSFFRNLSGDFRSISWFGKEYNLTRLQAGTVEELYDAKCYLSWTQIAVKIESNSGRMGDIFKERNAELVGLGSLIEPHSDTRMFRLNRLCFPQEK